MGFQHLRHKHPDQVRRRHRATVVFGLTHDSFWAEPERESSVDWPPSLAGLPGLAERPERNPEQGQVLDEELPRERGEGGGLSHSGGRSSREMARSPIGPATMTSTAPVANPNATAYVRGLRKAATNCPLPAKSKLRPVSPVGRTDQPTRKQKPAQATPSHNTAAANSFRACCGRHSSNKTPAASGSRHKPMRP